jgi:hypothetical protein
MEQVVLTAKEAALVWANEGLTRAQEQFNGTNLAL